MAEMLLINPRARRRARRAAVRRSPARARRRVARRRNPAPPVVAAVRRTVRRARRRTAVRAMTNPARRIHRRRRNPISLGGGNTAKGIMGMLKEAAIGGAGAVAFDVLMGKINPMLPMTLQTSPNSVGVGDAVKAVMTAVIGNALAKPTKGLSRKLAQGALTAQARDIISFFLPADMALGYASPARVLNYSSRVGPNRLSAYLKPGATPLLSAYTQPGAASPLLNAARVAQREGFKYR